MRLLPPQRLRPHYYLGVEEALRDSFADFVFRPLEKILAEGTTQASGIFASSGPVPSRELLAALRRGTVQYAADVVTGTFDSKLVNALRALGAEPTTFGGAIAFRLPAWAAPGWFRAEAAAAQSRAENIHKALERELDRMRERLEGGQMPLPLPAYEVVEAIEDGFESAASIIGITKRIPAGARAAMEERYAEQVRPYVAKATREYIDGAHKAITDNAARGYRFETIVGDIHHFVGISERKARFLARQETSMFMAGYRQERFTAAGVIDYKWSTSHDIRVRPYADEKKLRKYGDHRILDGQVFTYANKAPAQYMSFKKPCNPGEDAGCRCLDFGILR
jgi:hypothetical protein